jgi:hypothetical protein
VIIVGGIVGSRMTGGVPILEGYGAGQYSKLILLVGISLLVTCVGGVGWFFGSKSFKFPPALFARRSEGQLRGGLAQNYIQ